MIDAFNYFVFVLVPIFLLGFQAVLLAIIFFLRARRWLSIYAFAGGGFLAGLGFGYLYATLSGSTEALLAVCLSVGVFGVLSGAFWWLLLVKKATNGDEQA
ncbi:MAG: hypothetical protein GWM88_03220 [Pseudomonadales bacterium]|nr:hypothetical protein [Pseudomonadales bacterium]NIX07081.1 hypothetical protein [Pseudomonadales bacterium]